MRKLPKPIFTRAPAAIVDVEYRGHPFRVEMHGKVWFDAGPPHIEVRDGQGSEYNLYEEIGSAEMHRFRLATAMWSYETSWAETPDSWWPHRAIFRVLDIIVDKAEKARVERVVELKGVIEKARQRLPVPDGAAPHQGV